MTGNSIMRTTYNAAIWLITIMLAVVVFTLGPRLEVLINPVIRSFQINNSWFHDGSYFIEGTLLKTRGECEPTGIFILANGGFADPNVKVIRFDLSPDPAHYGPELTMRLAGAQYWGPWEVIPPEEPIGPIISIVITHQCHALWELTQVVYSGLTSEVFPGLVLDQEIPNGTTEFPEDN